MFSNSGFRQERKSSQFAWQFVCLVQKWNMSTNWWLVSCIICSPWSPFPRRQLVSHAAAHVQACVWNTSELNSKPSLAESSYYFQEVPQQHCSSLRQLEKGVAGLEEPQLQGELLILLCSSCLLCYRDCWDMHCPACPEHLTLLW